MTNESIASETPMNPSPGDVIFSDHCLPVPDAILHPVRGFGPESLVDFRALQGFLEFLEFTVMTERLIMPVARFSDQTQRMRKHPMVGTDFRLFRLPGECDLHVEEVCDHFMNAGVLFDAVLDIGESTADALVERLLPSSDALRVRHEQFLKEYEYCKPKLRSNVATAMLAFKVGAPLHVAEAAGLAGLPYVLGPIEQSYLETYDKENARVRKTVAHILLQRFNEGAKKELAQLSELGLPVVFPQTPIASMIVRESGSARDMMRVALQLRTEFASFRRELNEMEFQLANENQSVKARLKQLRKLEQLSMSLWPKEKRDFKRTAIGVSEAILAIPELAVAPSASAAKNLAARLAAVPADVVIEAFRRRKVRLLLKAKKTFLEGKDTSAHLAAMLKVGADVLDRSRLAHASQPATASGRRAGAV